MSPLLLAHIAAGGTGILSGAAALTARKGDRAHRTFGAVFVLSMAVMAGLAVYLAGFVPPVGPSAAPPRASIAVAGLTLYLVATAWMTARRKTGRGFETFAFAVALGIAAAMAAFGIQAAARASATAGPYFVFALFAAFAAALDLKVVVRGGIAGAPRIARHLWRMCFALFFATSFFFIGQQKVMPASVRGSPFLLVLAFAPLLWMIVWMVRVRLTRRFAPARHEEENP